MADRPDNPSPEVCRAVRDIPASGIREIANEGMARDGVIPLWFGESDLATPDFIRDAAKASLDAGETFYSQNEGTPELRAAIAKYLSQLYSAEISDDRVLVTASGMVAIGLVMETILNAGDNMVMVFPVWPNCRDAVVVRGSEVRAAPLRLKESAGGPAWRLDLDELFAQVDERTRAIFVNSPSNPTGWVMSAEEQRAVLDFCRARGLWLVADEVYDRIYYDGVHAPSLLQIATPDDPVIAINSFSKSWCMTGWRLGWTVAPARLAPIFGKLIEFDFSCTPVFVQRAGIAALERGEEFVNWSVDRYRRSRDLAFQRLAAHPRVHLALPAGALYAFFSVEGMTDDLAFARDLLDRTGVGLAPGATFGIGGEGYLRMCFAAAPETISTALDKLEDALE